MRKATRFFQVLLLVALFSTIIVSGQVQARLRCRSDPAVILSNGMILDIGANISTLPWQVTEAHYELHVPVGVSMVAAIHTPTWLTSQETFTFYADQPAGQYQVITTVHTTEGDASVVADTTLVSLQGIRLGRYTVSGMEGEALSVSFKN